MLPERYVTVVADCPWTYRDGLTMSAIKRSSMSQYRTLTVPQIVQFAQRGPLRLAGHRIAVDAFLWLWVTNPILLEGAGVHVARAWGFEPRQLVTWVKGRVADSRLIPQIGLGHFTRGATEHLLLCTRGRTTDLLANRRTPNVFVAPRTTHSRKPDAAFQLIEQLTPGPRLELFARQTREGWTAWGDELAA